MGRLIDLTNQKFGRLTVLERDYSKAKTYWICQCECGVIKSVWSRNLRTGRTKSCGCLNKEKTSERFLIDLSNHKYGRLTVLKRDLNKDKDKPYWICQCECGNFVSVSGYSLKSGHTKSCGLLQKEMTSFSLLKDLTGQVFNKLTVIKRDETRADGHAYWACQCECGNIKSIQGSCLRSGAIQSCGCLKSKGEEKIAKALNDIQCQYKSQYEFQDLKGDVDCLKFDFAIMDKNENLFLIEYQGEQHYKATDYFGGENEFKKRQKYDEKKRLYCKKNNFILIEIPYWDIGKINGQYLLSLMEAAREAKRKEIAEG